MLLVYRYRVKSLTGLLNAQARACNFLWNFCNDTQKHALKWNKRWPSGFDLNRLTAGSSKELALPSGTINAVCEQYANSRSQKQLPFLRWRGRRSLGWVPFKGRALKREGNAFRFAGNTFRVFNSRPVRSGIGIDLGLKDFAALSNGEKIENPRYLRQLAAGLAKSHMAKSVLDAGWSSFRNMLRYKALAHGAWYEEVNESFSTRVCSSCGCETGPKGVAELGIRSWICSECGMSHDRDINSARNILFRSGHRTPAEGIPTL